VCYSWLGMNGCRRKTVARPDNLAQASLSRPGEMSRGSPRLFTRGVAQATNSVLSERVSRSGEGSLA